MVSTERPAPLALRLRAIQITGSEARFRLRSRLTLLGVSLRMTQGLNAARVLVALAAGLWDTMHWLCGFVVLQSCDERRRTVINPYLQNLAAHYDLNPFPAPLLRGTNGMGLSKFDVMEVDIMACKAGKAACVSSRSRTRPLHRIQG